MLDEREALARLGPIDQEANADAAQESFLPLRGAYDLDARGCRVHRYSFSLDISVARIYGHRGDLSIYLQDTYVRSKAPLSDEAAS